MVNCFLRSLPIRFLRFVRDSRYERESFLTEREVNVHASKRRLFVTGSSPIILSMSREKQREPFRFVPRIVEEVGHLRVFVIAKRARNNAATTVNRNSHSRSRSGCSCCPCAATTALRAAKQKQRPIDSATPPIGRRAAKPAISVSPGHPSCCSPLDSRSQSSPELPSTFRF